MVVTALDGAFAGGCAVGQLAIRGSSLAKAGQQVKGSGRARRAGRGHRPVWTDAGGTDTSCTARWWER